VQPDVLVFGMVSVCHLQ